MNHYHLLRISIIIAMLYFQVGINAQEKELRKSTHEVMQSNGMEKIAKQIHENGWISFKSEARLSANNIFKNHKDKFGLTANDQMKLKRSSTDSYGYTHFRFEQLHRGIKVEFSQVNLTEKNGVLLNSSGSVTPELNINCTAKINEIQAFNSVIKYVSDKYNIPNDKKLMKNVQIIGSELAILPMTKMLNIFDDYLTYKFTVAMTSPLLDADIYVDAQTGDIRFFSTNIIESNAIGIASTLYSGEKEINAWQTGNSYQLFDSLRGSGILTYNMNNQLSFNNAEIYTDNDNYWTPANAAYDLHWGLMQCYDYFSSEFGLNSFDDNGHPILGYAHYGANVHNAFYNSTHNRFFFGDGISPTSTPLTTIDIVGHEFMHAITHHSAGLVYQNESGALNESFSDIFGIVIEHYAKPQNNYWKIGEECSTDAKHIRSLTNPKQGGVHASNIECHPTEIDGRTYYVCDILNYGLGQPDTYRGDFWYSTSYLPYGGNDYNGVHINSGVQNHWFYLLTEGGSGFNDDGDAYNIYGIGMDKASEIAFRNLYYKLGPTSSYHGSRIGSLQAAEEIFGENSIEKYTVNNAWHAVGIGDKIPMTGMSFEDGITDGWYTTKYASDDLLWTQKSGSTPSSYTGPSTAHHGNDYVYVEASYPNYPSKRATLEYPNSISDITPGSKLAFNYHMYGSDMGELKVELLATPASEGYKEIWSKSGDQGNEWHYAEINLDDFVNPDPYSGGLKQIFVVRFTAITGNGYKSDIALDKVLFANCSTANQKSAEPVVPAPEINEYADIDMEIFPNPSQGNFTIHFINGELSNAQIMIYTLEGRRIHSFQNVNGVETNIDLSNLDPGIYYVRLLTGDNYLSKKVIIQ